MTYAAVAVVFCALTGLGTLPARMLGQAQPLSRLLRLPLLVIAGWGLASLLSAIGAVVDLNQIWLARVLLVGGLLLLVPWGGDRHRALPLLGGLALLLFLMAPMGMLVAATPAMVFDEFAQWLPNTRFLLEHGHYWGWPEWIGLTSKPGYPNASAVVPLLTSQLIGPNVEAPFKTFVVILMGAYAAALADLAAARVLPDIVRPWRVLAALLSVACLVVLLDPFADPRIAFTAYTDAPSGMLLAIAALVACRGLSAARQGAMSPASVWFTWVGLISLTLILLRQTNLVLVGSLDAACAIVLLSGRAGAPCPWPRWALLVIGPAALGAIVWQVHVWAARIGPDIAPRPLAEWNWAAPLIVLRAFFLDRLLDNELVGGAALIFVAAAIIGVALVWRRFARDDRNDDLPAPRIVVPVTAIVCFGYVVFLAWAYIAVFSDVEVAAAVSLWRYLSELGPLLIAAGLCILLQLAPRRTPHPNSMIATAAIATAALMLLPSVGRGYYRLDCRFRDVAAARGAIAELRPALSSFANAPTRPARVAVVNATMGDWMAYALAFDMHWPASGLVVRFRTRNEPLAATEAWAWVQGLDAVLNLVPLDRAALRTEATIPPVSLLGRPAAKGDPWTMLATTQPHGFPACRMWSR